ncbi:M14 family zinc carboxypeptidase [Serinibacter arcticus]|nr:M14 family zinc carboxypeptidase [Serinibacter arcticus]
MSRSTAPQPPRPPRPPRARRATRVGAAAAAIAVATAGLAALAGPATADPADPAGPAAGPTLFTVEPGDLDPAALSSVLDGLDVVSATESQVTVLGDAETRDLLDGAGLEIVEDVAYADAIDGGPAVGQRSAARAATGYPLPELLADNSYETFFGGYRTVAAHTQYLYDLEEAYGDLVEVVDYGDSWLKTQGRGGHDLLAIRITAGADTDGDWSEHTNEKPRFYLTAQAHPREIITSELAWRFATEVIDGYGTDPEITHLLDTTELWVAPQNNPDGAAVVETALSGAVPTNAAGDATPPNSSKAWQRKNLNDTLFTGTSPNYSSQQPGIDLNRNYATAWGGESTSANPNAATYKGEAPFSEPEAATQVALLKELFGEFKVGTETAAPADRQGVYVNLHSYSDYVIYPYAYDRNANVPNLEPIKALGFRQSAFNQFNTGKAGEILYNNAGNDIDWIYDEIGIPAYTWEIGTAQTGGFFPSYARAETFWNAAKPALLYGAEAASDPYVSPLGPTVTDATLAYDVDGNVTVVGSASDDTYGSHPGSLTRRPVTHAVTDVEVVVGDPATAVAVAASVEPSVTTTFTGLLQPDWDVRERQWVHVRAKNAAGHWGPWNTSWLEPGPLRLTDVGADNQFFREIRWLVDAGISTGWENGDGSTQFRPLNPIARDAVAAFLYRLADSPDFELPEVSPFTDVATDNQFYREIAWLAEEGIATGWTAPDGTKQFRPLEPVARDAIAAFLYRTAQSPEFDAPDVSPFTDIAPGDAFYTEVTWLADTGVATGWQGNDGTALYRPLAPIARDAFAAFLYRYVDPEGSEVVEVG